MLETGSIVTVRFVRAASRVVPSRSSRRPRRTPASAGPSASLIVSPSASNWVTGTNPAPCIHRDDLIATLQSRFRGRARLEDLGDERAAHRIGARAEPEADELAPAPSSEFSALRVVR